MQYETIKLPRRKFIGIAIRTANTEKHKFDIAGMWARFFGDEIYNKIPNVIGDDFYGVYCQYAGDYTDTYTFVAACEVSSIEEVPEEMVAVECPEQNFAVINVTGEFPKELIETWHKIWKSPLKRNYEVDLEHYGADFRSKSNGITLYIGIEQ